MFSNLGPLFKVHFRQAEPNDTRQHIPHEEKDQQHKKDDSSFDEREPRQQWTDDTVVSVVALRSFLIDFLKTLPESDDNDFIKNHDPKMEKPLRPKENKRPTNTRNAKAVRAYQTMAAHTSDKELVDKIVPEGDSDHASSTQIQSKELREIHQLIIDLENLEKRGIQTLNILRAETFIDGMKRAVLTAKLKL